MKLKVYFNTYLLENSITFKKLEDKEIREKIIRSINQLKINFFKTSPYPFKGRKQNEEAHFIIKLPTSLNKNFKKVNIAGSEENLLFHQIKERATIEINNFLGNFIAFIKSDILKTYSIDLDLNSKIIGYNK